MAAHFLTPEAQRENAAALSQALGLTIAEAAEALDLEIVITANPTDAIAQQISREVAELVSRTVRRISVEPTEARAAAELVIGCATPRTSAIHVYVEVRSDYVAISSTPLGSEVCARIPGIYCLLSACYASAAILYRALGSAFAFTLPDPFVVHLNELGIDPASLDAPINIDRAYMAGAGAIGNGFLWAARHLQLHGQLDIADDDYVSSGNLNRQIWFDTTDIELPKVRRLCRKAQDQFPLLKLVPRQCRLQELAERSEAPWLRRLVVAVDSRRARRALQNEFPGEVFDASTTDIREVVVHYHAQPTPNACLSCIYEPDQEEISREQHIADHLGVSLDEVRSERISETAARTISTKFPSLSETELTGTAYDTLFKRLCAEGQLRTISGRTLIAPFAFVSVLAGTLLALEFVRRLGAGSNVREFNYWRLSPWHPPWGRRRMLRPKQPGCSFCRNPVLARVNDALWKR